MVTVLLVSEKYSGLPQQGFLVLIHLFHCFMKKFFSLPCSAGATALLLLAAAPLAQAQTGIGTRNPDASAVLDVASTNRGLLIPRVALASATDGTTIPSPATSLIVYNTSLALAGPGIYYNSGTSASPSWVRFISSSAPVGLEYWGTTGNVGTNPSTNFLGTTDSRDLLFKVNNRERFRIRPGGSSNGTALLSSDFEVSGRTTLAGDVKVTGNNSETTLRKTSIGLPSDKSEFFVYGDATISGASTSPNGPVTGGALTVTGATTLNNALTVAGASKFTALGGTGTRLVVADGAGNLGTQAFPSPVDAVLNQSGAAQAASFNISGTGRIGSTLNVLGATTLAGLSAGSSTLGSATIGSTLGVSGATTLGGLTAGATTLNSATVTNALGAGTLAVTGAATLNSTLTVGNATTLNNALTVAGVPKFTTLGGTGTRLVVADGVGNLSTQALPDPSLAILNQTGPAQAANFHISGSGLVGTTLGVGTALTVGTTLGVGGLSTLNSAAVTNNATVGGTLNVTGTGTINGATALGNTLTVAGNAGLSTLSTSGLATLASAKVNSLIGGGSRVVVADNNGTLSATSTLPGLNGEFIVNSGTPVAPAFSVPGSGSIGASLTVSGNSMLGGLTAGATTLSSATVTNALSAGALVVGGGASLNNTLTVAGVPTFNTLGGQGTRLVVTDNSGNLSTQPIPMPVVAIENQNAGDQSANFRISGSGRVGSLIVNSSTAIGGNSTVGGTLEVSGLSTLNALGVSGNAAVGGTLNVTGTSTLNGATALNGPAALGNTLNVAGQTTLTTLATSDLATLASAKVTSLAGPGSRVVVTAADGTLSAAALPGSNNEFIANAGAAGTSAFNVTGSGQIGTTLTVNGATTLADLTAGPTTLGSATVGSTLGVSGATTLGGLTAGPTTLSSTLSVAGVPTFTTLGGTGTRLVVADGVGNLSTQALPDPSLAILNQTGPAQAANFHISGSGLVGTTLGVGTALTVGTTLGVGGLSTLNSAAVTNNATVGGTLGVSGATTLDNTLAVAGASAFAGRVGIGTVVGTEFLTVGGNVVPGINENFSLGTASQKWNMIHALNGTVQTSDARLKTNVTGLGYGLRTVMALRPVRYAWKKTPNQTNKIGFIAQELQKVVPEVVFVGTDADQTLGVNYAELVPVLVNALQEQQAQLDTMRGRAEKAEAAVQSFESRLRALEAGRPANATAQGQR